jgi:hypothetical protein
MTPHIAKEVADEHIMMNLFLGRLIALRDMF